jgi:NADH-quinone oxidoreductase subunit K
VIPAGHVLILAALLFAIGVAGATMRRNVVIVLMSIELMLNAVNITLITAAHSLVDVNGQVFVFFSLSVAASEVAVGLALVVAIYRSIGTTDVDDVSVMHG